MLFSVSHLVSHREYLLLLVLYAWCLLKISVMFVLRLLSFIFQNFLDISGSDKNVYTDVNFNEKLIQDLTETSKKIFTNLKNGGFITDKDLKYFSFDHKRTCNLGKLYFLPKIHKRLLNVPGQPVISNCGTPREKASEFLDSHLKMIMQESWSYIKDSANFINKISQIGHIPENAILVTVDVVGLYASTPRKVLATALKKEKRENKDNLLKDNFFEFTHSVKQQVSGMAIGTKCAPTYACIYIWMR